MKITEKNLGRKIVRDIVIIILLLLFFVVIPVTINRIRYNKAKRELKEAKEKLMREVYSTLEQLKKSQKERNKEFTDAIRGGEVIIGMTKKMVREVYGPPQRINKTVTANGISEQWVYGEQFL